MAKRPTPVLVVSGYTQRDNVFRALELGALDFIAKPSREVSSDLKNIERDLVQKITVVRRLQAVRLRDRAQSLAAASRTARMAPFPGLPTTARSSPRRVIAIAASTGGPPAIQQLLCALPGDLPVAIIVAQHMPARFTRAFAERLDRLVGFRVVEARDGEPLCVGSVYIAPGSSNVEVERRVLPPWATVRVVSPRRERGVPTITPSADHLFKSLAGQYGRELCVVVLTGMGSDGREGSIAARHAGATVLAEDPASAVMPGMPYSTIEAGVVHGVHRLEELPTAIMQFARHPTESSS
jgi:two-component system chemotaxis response regulator CheB